MFRRKRSDACRACLMLASALALTSMAAAKKPGSAPAPYAVIDLGGFAGGTHVQSSGHRLSNPDESGFVTVAGDSRSASGDFQAAVWTAHPDLGPLTLENLSPSSVQGEALDANDAGWVVGWKTEFGYLSIPGQPLVELPDLSADERSSARPTAVNDANQIAGLGLVDVEVVVDGDVVIAAETHGLLWQADETGAVGDPIDLGFFFPSDINEFGMMVGYSCSPDKLAAVAAVDEMGNVSVQEVAPLLSELTAVNDFGEAVGWLQAAAGEPWQAFLWDIQNGIQLLGVLPNKDESIAYGINNHREIVGVSIGMSKARRPSGSAFLWRDGVMMDLNAQHDGGQDFYAWTANDINDAGQILIGLRVYLSRNDSESHAGLLVPNAPQR